ncbi:hypothetical protein [uncultured Paenibacillus sp.]|uniref:hypothetical protein n=1 Tax=uncultured Paenibacillus sp. TaxID=227322 RepID=UPI0015B2A3F2|nr:hypothetical protein [uncultured Paenibacillus sp.]
MNLEAPLAQQTRKTAKVQEFPPIFKITAKKMQKCRNFKSNGGSLRFSCQKTALLQVFTIVWPIPKKKTAFLQQFLKIAWETSELHGFPGSFNATKGCFGRESCKIGPQNSLIPAHELAAHRLPLVACRSSPAAGRSPPAACRLPIFTCRLPPAAARRSPPTPSPSLPDPALFNKHRHFH